LNYVEGLENEKYNYKRGYTENISVRKPWRGRGVAKALLVKSMKMFRDMGFDHTALGVDTENAAGAYQLYESVGYKVVRITTVYRKQFNP
jgi:mycothiol synthase